MKKYKVKIEPEALADIQEITDWYNKAQAGLGKRFQKTASSTLTLLTKTHRFMPFVTKKFDVWLLRNSHTWLISTLTMKTIRLKF